jgi:hypothetical protein
MNRGIKMMNYRRRIVLAGFFCMIAVPQTILGEGERRSGAGLFDTLPGPAWLGCTLIGAEYLLGPLVASQYWWKEGLARNPFENIVESEPYLEDKIWHCANGATLTDLHYWTLNKFFNVDSRWGAMGMTFLTLTAVELLDGSDRSGKWGVSWRDEAGNISGIMLWYLRQRYPSFVPIDVRLGIRRWNKVPSMIKNFAGDITSMDTRHYESLHLNNYSIFKAEIIVRPYSYFYTGLAVSCKTDGSGMGIPENLFGVTAGIDVLRWYANRRKGKFTPFANFIGQNLSLPLSFTFWFGK